MSENRDLVPVLFDFVPKGPTAVDAAMYKVMRRMARLNRQFFWDTAHKAVHEVFFYGTSHVKIDWGQLR